MAPPFALQASGALPEPPPTPRLVSADLETAKAGRKPGGISSQCDQSRVELSPDRKDLKEEASVYIPGTRLRGTR